MWIGTSRNGDLCFIEFFKTGSKTGTAGIGSVPAGESGFKETLSPKRVKGTPSNTFPIPPSPTQPTKLQKNEPPPHWTGRCTSYRFGSNKPSC